MDSLKKQQKKGYYLITLGYEKQIDKHILNTLDAKNEDTNIASSAILKDLQREFAPGSQTLKYLGGMIGIRILHNIYIDNQDSFLNMGKSMVNKSLNIASGNSFLNFFVNNFMVSFLYLHEKILGSTTIPEEVRLSLFYNILYSFLFANQKSKLKEFLCNVELPITFLRNLDKFGIQKVQNNLKGGGESLFGYLTVSFIINSISDPNLLSFFGSSIITLGTSLGLQKMTNDITKKENIQNNFNKVFEKIGWNKFIKTFTLGNIINLWKKSENTKLNASEKNPDDSMISSIEFLGKKFPGSTSTHEKNKSFLQNPWNDMFQKIGSMYDFFEKWWGSATRSIVLFGGLTVGSIVFQHVICKRVFKDHIYLEIDHTKFNKIIEKILTNLNPRFIYENEYQKEVKKKMICFTQFSLENKLYTDTNTVNNQIHLIIKDMLKNLPQNTFIEKIEYYGYDEDNALLELPDDFNAENNNNTEKSKKKIKDKKQKNKEIPYDVVQVIYDVNGKEKYDESEITTVDRLINKYAKQYHLLYLYKNRKTFMRKYLFDRISEKYKPQDLSPSISSYYMIHFVNKSDNNLKPLFNDPDNSWFFLKQTKKKEFIDENENKRDIYVVKLKITNFVQKHIFNILENLPKSLKVLYLCKPPEIEDTKIDCEYFQLFPIDKENKCFIPNSQLSDFDISVQSYLVDKSLQGEKSKTIDINKNNTNYINNDQTKNKTKTNTNTKTKTKTIKTKNTSKSKK